MVMSIHCGSKREMTKRSRIEGPFGRKDERKFVWLTCQVLSRLKGKRPRLENLKVKE